jgi:ABC-2 type transport system ATP-binding protein
MTPILEVKNIHKQYAHHKALNDVSIVIEPKKIFGLLGPNGAGKTSLIRIINQITGPDKGEIFFNGENYSQNMLNTLVIYQKKEVYTKKCRLVIKPCIWLN